MESVLMLRNPTKSETLQLLPFAFKILRTSEIARNAIRTTYSHVFLDEFQDCTSDQYELIKLLFKGTSIVLTAVGDTKQTIMGWAGALDGIFKTYHDDFAARPLRLFLNFRSQPRLLRMQNDVIRAIEAAAVMPDDLIDGEGGRHTHRALQKLDRRGSGTRRNHSALDR